MEAQHPLPDSQIADRAVATLNGFGTPGNLTDGQAFFLGVVRETGPTVHRALSSKLLPRASCSSLRLLLMIYIDILCCAMVVSWAGLPPPRKRLCHNVLTGDGLVLSLSAESLLPLSFCSVDYACLATR